MSLQSWTGVSVMSDKRKEIGHETRIVQLLDEWGLKYRHIPTFPIDKINERYNALYQSRIQLVYPELVNQYALQMDAGAEFPPIIVMEKPKGFVILDGKHRYEAAAKIGRLTLAAYEVTNLSDEERIALFVLDCNIKLNGLRPSESDTLALMVAHHMKYGTPCIELSRLSGISRTRIEEAVRYEECKLRFAKVGLEVPDKRRLAPTNAVRLYAIPSDAAFKAAAVLVFEAKLCAQQVSDLVKDIREKSASEAEQLAEVDAWRNKPEVELALQGRKSARPPRHNQRKFLGSVSAIANLVEKYKTPPEMQITNLNEFNKLKESYYAARKKADEWFSEAERHFLETQGTLI